MPIDLKWVRTDPNQVREWQNLRRRRRRRNDNEYDNDNDEPDTNNDNDDDNDDDLVGAVLHKDELSRKKLQTLQEYKTCLKQLQLRLRPPSMKKNSNNKTNDNDNATAEQKQEQVVTTKSKSNRQDLMEEKKVLEEKIKRAEAVWKASLKDTHDTLCKLASPVTTVVDEDGHVDDDDDFIITKVITPPPSFLPNSKNTRSSIGMDLEQAWKQYTLRHFAAYLWMELPRGVPVVIQQQHQQQNQKSESAFSINPDRAHELWGCCGSTTSSSSAATGTTSSNSCPICKVAAASTTDPSSSSSSSKVVDDAPIVILPAWIRLLTEFLPNKTIWGERELPRYTALWSNTHNQQEQEESNTICWLGRLEECDNDNDNNASKQDSSAGVLTSSSYSSSSLFSLELVAIAASSVVDAREIQNDLLEKLFDYYGGLLLLVGIGSKQTTTQTKNKLVKRVVAAPDLNSHEWSRVEIHVELTDNNTDTDNDDETEHTRSSSTTRSIHTFRLGWVSHWGDAASRACDMSFAGGGIVRAGGKKNKSNTATKEYVHVVQASVVDDSSSTWNKILYANSNIANCSTNADADADVSKRKEKRVLVNVPPVLVPYLIRPHLINSSIRLEELVIDSSSKKKKKETVFGVRDDTTTTTAAIHVRNNTAHNNNKQQQTVIPSNNSRMGMVAAAVAGGDDTRDKPKFPPFVLPSCMSKEELQQRIRLEKLSCPFDFLF